MEPGKILFSSSLVPSNTKLMRNHDRDTQLPRALAILSCSFWRSSLRKGGGQTSCRRSSANMISTTIRSFGPLRIQTANGSMHERKALFTEKLHAILAVLFLVETTQLMNSNRHSINFRALFYEQRWSIHERV